MRIVFNSGHRTAAATVFYENAFKGLPGISFHDDNFATADIALFMTYDHQWVRATKEHYPHLKIGLIDPRSPAIMADMPYCDFLVVDSIEMEDYWRMSKKPIARYVEYPDLNITPQTTSLIQSIRSTRKNDIIYIGYHGNSYHIMEGENTLLPAIAELNKKYNIELLLMHNSPAHAKRYSAAMPKDVTTHRVAWSMENYIKFLSLSHIGLVPNNLGAVPKEAGTTGDPNTDYCLSFKMTSNPGRFAVFGLLGIPVVADFYPSSLQYLQNGCGLVAHSEAGWYHSLETLIQSPELRTEMGNNLQNLVHTEFDFAVQNKNFLLFLEQLVS
jgi:hypothetical protein